MAYVGIDAQGARTLGTALGQAARRTEDVRQEVIAALTLADLASTAPQRLGQAEDGFTSLSAGVAEKAELAERFVADPQKAAAGIGASAGELGAVLSGLLGFAGPADLRAILLGLPKPGADKALDAALVRLNPVLLPAMLAGKRPEVPAELAEDLRLLALRMGIEQAGPPVGIEQPEESHSFFGRLLHSSKARGNTEVFWADFWADGRTVPEVLADPQRLLDWVTGSMALDRRLSLAPELPGLGDMLASFDFATKNSSPADLAASIAAAEAQFSAIATWLPAFLAGRTSAAPDATQLAQALAFAAAVGWGGATGTDQERFTAAVGYLRANRVLQSALLPPGFEGDSDPLAFFNEAGIKYINQLGRSRGLIDPSLTAGLSKLVDQVLGPATAAPAELTDQVQQKLFALLATQIPRSMATSPAIQAQFVAALGFLRQATDGADQRARIVSVLTAFRTLAVTGAPALTERQLSEVVGERLVDVLGRGRLRLRSAAALKNSPEFFLVARQWGIPGGKRQDIGKYKFTWEFDELGVLVGIRRKKKSWLTRAFETIKAVGKAIWESWEDNPFKAIFQVGKIALSVLAFAVPGLQGLGAAALALNLGDAAFHAIEGDWLGAIGSGLAAFTAGADIFGAAATTAVQSAQSVVLEQLFDPATLGVFQDARRLFEIGTSIFKLTQADSLLETVGAGLGAVATGLGSGGQLLQGLEGVDPEFAKQLIQLGTTVRDAGRLVVPAFGLAQALDGGDAFAAFTNGLSIASAGAIALADPKGVFEFDKATRESLIALAKGTGVVANVSRAILAADQGQAFNAGSALAAAVQSLNGVTTAAPGEPVEIGKRVAELGAVLEAVFKGASATAAAPLVLDRLTRLTDVLAPTPLPVTLPEPSPIRTGAAGEATGTVVETFGARTLSAEVSAETLVAEVGAHTLVAEAGAQTLVAGAGVQTLAGDVVPIPVQPLNPEDLPPLVQSGLDTASADLLPPPPPPVEEDFWTRAGKWLYSWYDDGYPRIDHMGFQSNPILDGLKGASLDVAFEFGLTGVSVSGPAQASYRLLGGFGNGFNGTLGESMPVTNPTDLEYLTLTGVQVEGIGGTISGIVKHDEVTGEGSKDFFIALNVPGWLAPIDGTVGGHLYYENDGPWQVRFAQPGDFISTGFTIGPSILLGRDTPIEDPDLVNWLVSFAANVPLADAELNALVPAGTRLTFSPAEDVVAAAGRTELVLPSELALRAPFGAPADGDLPPLLQQGLDEGRAEATRWPPVFEFAPEPESLLSRLGHAVFGGDPGIDVDRNAFPAGPGEDSDVPGTWLTNSGDRAVLEPGMVELPLTPDEIAAIAPPGIDVEFGDPPPYAPAEDDLSIPSLAQLEASAPAGVSIDGAQPDPWWGNLSENVAGWGDNPVPGWTDEAWNDYASVDLSWQGASLEDTGSWPVPDGIELGGEWSEVDLSEW